MISLPSIFASLSDEEAQACYDALAQWAENEACRDDLEEDEPLPPQVKTVQGVVARLEEEFVKLAVHDPGPQP